MSGGSLERLRAAGFPAGSELDHGLRRTQRAAVAIEETRAQPMDGVFPPPERDRSPGCPVVPFWGAEVRRPESFTHAKCSNHRPTRVALRMRRLTSDRAARPMLEHSAHEPKEGIESGRRSSLRGARSPVEKLVRAARRGGRAARVPQRMGVVGPWAPRMWSLAFFLSDELGDFCSSRSRMAHFFASPMG